MVTKKEAMEIALAQNPKYDTITEYADAYEFSINDGEIHYGGADNSCIIEKSTGKHLRWYEYFMDGKRNVVETVGPQKIEDILL